MKGEVAASAYVEGPPVVRYGDKAGGEGIDNDYEDHRLTMPNKEDTNERFTKRNLGPGTGESWELLVISVSDWGVVPYLRFTQRLMYPNLIHARLRCKCIGISQETLRLQF